MFLVFLSFIHFVYGHQNPLVITKYGPILGNSYKTSNGVTAYEFLGVPFAAPPIGNLRFEKPQSPIPWTQPFNATVYAPFCVPCISETHHHSEDCLYLNIWTPALNNSLLPVVVYIHGGGYVSNGNGRIPNEAFKNLYAQEEIVVVSIQYRLGFFGFLTLNDTRLEANLGLWDQNLALKWVQDNIGRFGGNQKRVTIWGTSAGSTSVGQHTVSPKSWGLFSQAYEQSGSPLAAFARGDWNIEFSADVIIKLGCRLNGDVKGCLRTKSIRDFSRVSGGCSANDFDLISLSPMFDGDFFTEEPELAIQHAPLIHTLIGLNMDEGRMFTPQSNYSFSISEQDWPSMTDDLLFESIEKWVAQKGYNDQAQLAAQDIYQFYARNYTNSSDYRFWIQQYDKIFTDTSFNVPVVREAILKTKAKSPVYTYVLDYFNQQTWPIDDPCQGSTHGSESPYCFEMPYIKSTNDDSTVSSLMKQFIIQFIKNGKPSIPGMTWDEFSPKTKNYLSLKPKPSMNTGLFSDGYDFWTNFMRKYRFDFVTRRDWESIPSL